MSEPSVGDVMFAGEVSEEGLDLFKQAVAEENARWQSNKRPVSLGIPR